jgi:hypothetical protein
MLQRMPNLMQLYVETHLKSMLNETINLLLILLLWQSVIRPTTLLCPTPPHVFQLF